MSSLTLKAKKLKNKSKDSCKKRKITLKRKIKTLEELPLTPFQILVLEHVAWWVNKNTRDGIAPLKNTKAIYTYQTMEQMTKYLTQKDPEASMSKVQRALKRLHEVKALESGFYAPKRYEKHGGKLSRLQYRKKSYTTTAKGRKILEQLEHAKRQKKRNKCISINNKISDNSPLLKSALKKENSATQGSPLKILRTKFQEGQEPDEKDRAYFDKRMGKLIPKQEKDRLWFQVCEENKKFQNRPKELRYQITDPIAWAYCMYWTNPEERSRKAKEQYAKTKDTEKDLLGREASLRGMIGKDMGVSDCRAEFSTVFYNLQNNKPSTATPKLKPYKAIVKAAPPEEVCEYLEGYSVSINNMLPFFKSKDESSISSMISCGVWVAEDLEVARRLAKEKWGV